MTPADQVAVAETAHYALMAIKADHPGAAVQMVTAADNPEAVRTTIADVLLGFHSSAAKFIEDVPLSAFWPIFDDA